MHFCTKCTFLLFPAYEVTQPIRHINKAAAVHVAVQSVHAAADGAGSGEHVARNLSGYSRHQPHAGTAHVCAWKIEIHLKYKEQPRMRWFLYDPPQAFLYYKSGERAFSMD